MLHAQRSAEDFYLRLGFAPRGEPFEEAGIPHIEMSRPIAGRLNLPWPGKNASVATRPR